MRDYPTTPSISTPTPHKSNSPMVCYSVMVVAGVSLVLGIYHLIVIRLCTIQYQRRLQQEEAHHLSVTQNPPNSKTMLSRTISSFKYTNKEARIDNESPEECSVCLSVFEEGEEVKRLPMCDHCFHASCIDMWLYSHTRCPLCRAPVIQPPPPPPV